MRLLLLILVVLTAAVQYALWWGKGGWLRAHELQQTIATQKETNQALLARNNAMKAEDQELKSDIEAIKEQATGDLGLVKKEEHFVKILAPNEHPHKIKTPKQKPSNRNTQKEKKK